MLNISFNYLFKTRKWNSNAEEVKKVDLITQFQYSYVFIINKSFQNHGYMEFGSITQETFPRIE